MSTPGPASRITTHRVQAPGGGLHVIDQPGTAPPVVLLHGFPDDSRIYDRLVPTWPRTVPSPSISSATAAPTARAAAPTPASTRPS
jgi:2-hydroxy-6-oxonona-2,4-dienedioate hydrolase